MQQRAPVNLRSIALGLLGVVLIAALTPFNDWAANNTYLIGSYLPIGLVLFFLLFVVLINGPLSRWAPDRAFGRGEIAVALAMVLVSCAVPASGFMKYVTNGLIGIHYQAGANGNYANLLRELNLPAWMFPATASHDPVISDFWGRAYTPDDSFIGHLRAVPWRAWMKPMLAWGIFAAAMWGAILCGAAIVRRQWVVNERLPFPLAGVYLSLIEPPARGRMLNPLLRSWMFWLAAGAVFCAHSLNALATYSPRYFPKIPLAYDLSPFLSTPPLSFMFTELEARVSSVYFTVIGLTFFVQSKIAFSLWFFYVALQVARMLTALYANGQDVTYPMQRDQLFGAIIPYALLILWIGRKHWTDVWNQMIGRSKGDETAAARGFIACAFAMVLWLLAAGASATGAVVIVLMMLTIFLCIARIVAETGLMFGQLNVPLSRPFVFAAAMQSAWRPTLNTLFFSNFFTTLFTHDVRENLAVYSTHAMKVADESNVPRRRFIACLVLALAVSFGVSGVSQLYTEYTYAVTLDKTQLQPLSPWAAQLGPKMYTLDPTTPYVKGNLPPEVHNRFGHFALGAGLTTVLSVLRLRYQWWPLHPVGFLICSSYIIQTIWVSIFLGWLVKIVLLRFGGMDMFRATRTFFLGLVIGEAGAAAFWLVVSLIRVAMGLDYHAIRLFPA